MLAFPSLGGLSVSPKASGPLRTFNAMQGDALGMPGLVRAASSFHFGVVGGEGIAGLGVPTFPLPSSWRFCPGRPPIYS